MRKTWNDSIKGVNTTCDNQEGYISHLFVGRAQSSVRKTNAQERFEKDFGAPEKGSWWWWDRREGSKEGKEEKSNLGILERESFLEWVEWRTIDSELDNFFNHTSAAV